MPESTPVTSGDKVLASQYNALRRDALRPKGTYDPLHDEQVLYIPFLEGSGTKASDRSGNRNNGTISGAAWAEGKLGYCLEFDGVDDFVEIPDADSLDWTSPGLTITAWVYLNALPVAGKEVAILRKDNHYTCGFYGPSTIRNLVKTDGTDGWTSANDEAYTFETGQWYFWSFAYNGANVRHFINAKQVGSLHSCTGNIVTSTNPVHLAYYQAGGLYLDGRIDEVRIYPRTLTSDDLRALYDRGLGIKAPYVAIASGDTDVSGDASISGGLDAANASITGGIDADSASITHKVSGGSADISGNAQAGSANINGQLITGGRVGVQSDTPDGLVDIKGSTSDKRLKIGHHGDNPQHIVSYKDLCLDSHAGFYVRNNSTAGDPTINATDLVKITTAGDVDITGDVSASNADITNKITGGSASLTGEMKADSATIAHRVAANNASISGNAIIYANASVSGNTELKANVDLPNQSGCRVWLGTTQQISANSPTQIAFDTVTWDRQNEFDSTNHRFTVSRAGNYLVLIAAFVTPGAASDTNDISIIRNGVATNVTRWKVPSGGAVAQTMQVHGVVHCDANDYLEGCLQDYDNSCSISAGSSSTFLHIEKIG